MKKSGLLVAAASATAVSASSYSNFTSNSKIQFSSEGAVSGGRHSDNSSTQKANSSEKFAPRFDGLRFIETLVTAHR